MSDINFDGQKIQSTNINKSEFISELRENGIEEEKANSIFNKFNTNNNNASKDVLDKDEQLKFMQFMKTIANGDTTITDEEFAAQSKIANDRGIENQDVLSKVFNSFKSIIAKDESDDIEVEYSGNIANAKGSSSRKRVKYDLVTLTSEWKNSREIANDIDSDKYKGVKTKQTASEVLDAILTAQEITDVSDENKIELLKRLIKFNPSIFNRETGEVWEDADWSKLDFPKGKNVGKMINDNADLSNVGERSIRTVAVSKAGTLENPLMVNSSVRESVVANYNEGKSNDEQLRRTDATDSFGIYATKGKLTDKKYQQHYIYVDGKLEKLEKFIPDIKSNEYISSVTSEGKVYLNGGEDGPRQISIKYDESKKQFVDADKASTPITKATSSAEVKRTDDKISFVDGDETMATVTESSGWFSGDANLKISNGKYAGKYKFVDNDGDNLNFSNFKVKKDVNTEERYLSVGNNEITKLKGTDASGAEVEYPAKTNENGSIQVQVEGKWIPFEQFVNIKDREVSQSNADSAPVTDVEKSTNNISFTHGVTTYATVSESSGWFSGDSYLKISAGKYAGSYKFISDGDNLNYSKFEVVKDSNNNQHYLSVGNNTVSKLKGKDANGAEVEYDVKTNSNGSLLIKVKDGWIPLEQFVATS